LLSQPFEKCIFFPFFFAILEDREVTVVTNEPG
jgi:hypothetical protein